MADPAQADLLVTITISIDRAGNIHEDTQCHGNPWGEVYRGLVAVKDRALELVERRRECPFYPKATGGIDA